MRLGAVLYQTDDDDGKQRVNSVCFSRVPKKSEQNHPAQKLEILSLKWSIMTQSHSHLRGYNFTVGTDNNHLTYMLTSEKLLDDTGGRWVSELSSYLSLPSITNRIV